MKETMMRPGTHSSLSPKCVIVYAAAALAVLVSPVLAEMSVEQTWNAKHEELLGQIKRLKESKSQWRERLNTEALDEQALILPGDTDPLDVVLRRTAALVRYFTDREMLSRPVLSKFEMQLGRLSAAAQSTSQSGARKKLFIQACALRRSIAFANPLLNFDDIVCMLEQPGDRRIIEQARAVCAGHSNGGGPIIIENFKSKAECVQALAGVRVASGPWKGKELTGKFSGLELNYNGTELLFAATTSAEVWHVFRFNLVTKELAQLTDGPDDDFDPHQLPSGRIVFTSTRRRGVGRCVLTPQSLTYTLHSMEPDGSDIICLSFHETNEWAPTVNHKGKIAYTRWDYVDRHWGTAHHYWECFPDGRDPRNYHGNYPLPFSAMPRDVQPREYGKPALVYGRTLRPDAELSFRPVPNSPKYTATAVGHHEGFSGSLVLLDTRIPDDGKMAQLKRITPEYFFPEVENGATHTYGTAWPLSEDFYLCNYNFGLYLLDRFGNRDVIYEPGPGAYRVRDPFPLRPRRKPPVVPVMTWQGKRESLPEHRRAVISVMNVYAADAVGKLPEGVKVKWMRIVQVIPQMLDNWFSKESVSQISFATDSIGRIPLGVVPVEADGSVYCEAPVGKAIYFQLLDEKGMAVHSMRSATYVHPGEHLSCLGCHEDKWKGVPAASSRPMALKRPPSKLVPEVASGAVPFNYIQLVKIPVFDKKCVPCHMKNPKAPDMSYASLARNSLAFSYPGEKPALVTLGVGGSRTTPGRFGARASGIMKALTTGPQHKDVKLSDDERRRLTLWLDLNSNEIGWIGNDRSKIKAQKKGEALWPPIDVDPSNPTGVEKDFPVKAKPDAADEVETTASETKSQIQRNVTFIVTSDAHYDAFENEDRNGRVRDTLRHMNAITNIQWPEELGGGVIQQPQGVLVLGDVIDDGDRIFQGKHQTPRQWLLFEADFGLDGTEGLLAYPVYETWGNHDGPPVGKEKHGFSFQAQLKKRNQIRKQKGWLTNLSANGLHYSWDWDDVHFVQLGIYPADRQHPEVRYSPEWHDPQGALTFLKADLAEHVGGSGKPVVLASHCGFDTNWWHEDDWKAVYDAVKPYNIVLYFYGHSGTGPRRWAPPGKDKMLNCVNTGQTENGFFIVQITDNEIRLAYRIKHWLTIETSEGKRERTWDDTWEWKHLKQEPLRTAGVEKDFPVKAEAYEPTSHYTIKNIEGWKVYVNNGLLPGGEHAETGAAALKQLKSHMAKVKRWIPDGPLEKLLKVVIWLEVDSTNGPHGRTAVYQYHPDMDWLEEMDFHPGKHKCVEYGRASSLVKAGDRGAKTLLHELAHAYHDQILTFDDAEILAAYKRAVEGTAYPPKDWVKSDHKEFFAGVTTRYFGTKAEREALVERDPVLAKKLKKVWGKPKAFMDTPPGDRRAEALR